jgi:molybdate transport system substrate-binding protein
LATGHNSLEVLSSKIRHVCHRGETKSGQIHPPGNRYGEFIQQATRERGSIMVTGKYSIALAAWITILALLLVAGCTTADSAPVPEKKVLTVFAAASLKGVSAKLGPAFEEAYPGSKVTFNFDGTQILKQQVESGAYADLLLSADTGYTKALMNEGLLVNDSVRHFTSNYLIVIIPAANPGAIGSLADLGIPGKRIAMGTSEVPVGSNTRIVISNVANSTLTTTWKDAVFRNVKTFETTEPGILTKVSLGEVDAGFVYESSYKAAKAGTLGAVTIPEEENVLQIYSVGLVNVSSNRPAALAFEEFLLSAKGQKILNDFGFRSPS